MHYSIWHVQDFWTWATHAGFYSVTVVSPIIFLFTFFIFFGFASGAFGAGLPGLGTLLLLMIITGAGWVTHLGIMNRYQFGNANALSTNPQSAAKTIAEATSGHCDKLLATLRREYRLHHGLLRNVAFEHWAHQVDACADRYHTAQARIKAKKALGDKNSSLASLNPGDGKNSAWAHHLADTLNAKKSSAESAAPG